MAQLSNPRPGLCCSALLSSPRFLSVCPSSSSNSFLCQRDELYLQLYLQHCLVTLGFDFISFLPQIPHFPSREDQLGGVGCGHCRCLGTDTLVWTFLIQQEKCRESKQKSLDNPFIFMTWSSLFCRLTPAIDDLKCTLSSIHRQLIGLN